MKHPIVLVHGWGGSFSTTWKSSGFADLLEDAGRTVIGVDLLGHGQAPKPHSPEDYGDLTERILQAMPPEPVDLIGFSLGAITLLRLAIEHPERVKSLVVAGIGRNVIEADTQQSHRLIVDALEGHSTEENNLARLFQSITGQTIVGVLHTNVGGNNQHGNYAPCSSADLQTSPVNYWALGHIHDRQVHETPKGYWAYPGNLQGRSTKATECGAKGVLIVDVHEDGSLEKPRFVPCDAIRFQRLSIDLTDVSNNSDVLDIAIEKLKEAVADSEDRSLMVRLEFTGATEIYDEFIKDFEKTSSNIMGMSQDIMGDGAVVKVCHTCRRAIDLTIERTRKTILSFVLNELDSKTQEEIPDELRSAVELLLVDALGWAQ